MDDNTKEINECQKQKAHVKELKASGAIVSLEGGQIAWLPGNEMYPDYKPYEDFRERGKDLEGRDIDVIEFQDAIKSKQILVSYIRATNDPWKSISSWSDGEIKIMEVVAKTGVRVMGIVYPGVQAEVLLDPVREVLNSPSWQRFSMPLVGDEIAGLFHKNGVDEQNRFVTLDYLVFVQSQISIKDILSMYALETNATPIRVNNIDAKDAESIEELENFKALRGVNNILLVEDDIGFLRSLETFLKNRVSKVIACETYDDAEKEIEMYGNEFDLAIIDINIPKRKKYQSDNRSAEFRDHLGLTLARVLRTQYSGCSVVIITGEDVDSQHRMIKESEDLEVSAFYFKPFRVQDLYHAIAAAESPPKPILDLLPRTKAHDTNQRKEESSFRSDIHDTLDLLRKDINAEGVVLFSFHPITYAVDIVASSDPNGLYSAPQRKLYLSPVRDVAIDREVIFSKDARKHDELPKHLWLIRAYDYRSCIGINVSQSFSSQWAYALFAFHRNPRHFNNREHLPRVRLAASEIMRILYIKSLESELHQMKPFELMGKIYGSMAHELTELLSNEFHIIEFEEELRLGDCSVALQKLATLKKQSRRASDILHTFRGMARGQHDAIEDFNIEDELPNIVDNFCQKAADYNVRLYYEPKNTNPLKINMQRIGLEIIIYNLLLNAVQQIERVRFLRNYQGEILIELVDETDDNGAKWGVIKVHDNGPGVHKRDFKKVFDIHYTTKEGGCGMGLDISYKIAKSVERDDRKGNLLISRSILLASTTFELRLPLQ